MFPTATPNLCLHLSHLSGRLSRFRSISRTFRTTATTAKNARSLKPIVSPIIIEVPDDAPDEPFQLDYKSEPLGIPAANCFGFPRFRIGMRLGPDGRYTIVRKLGWGMHGSCWMVRDELEKRYVALKATSGYFTELTEEGVAHELKALSKTSEHPSPHCLSLLDHFKTPGVVEVDGQHVCLVTPLYGGDVATLLRTFSEKLAGSEARGGLPVALSKRILLHTLRGLVHAHECGVTHTDLKPGNVFFTTEKNTAALEAWMASDPARSHPPERSVLCTVEAVVSQPLPPPSMDEALRATYVLGDFSNAYASAEPPERDSEISPPELRAPEVWLGGTWGSAADMWSFGALVFELVCGRRLFEYAEPLFGGDVVDNMIMQMVVWTEEEFEPDVLAKWPLSSRFFNADGKHQYLIDKAEYTPLIEGSRNRYAFGVEPDRLERPIAMYMGDRMSVEEVMGMKDVMKRCLRLDPAKRASARELLEDPWWREVESVR